MEKIAVFVNDAEHALHIIQPMLKGEEATHWIIVATAPTLTRHIGRWVSHAARQQWLERWSTELFGQLEPSLRSVAGSKVELNTIVDNVSDLSSANAGGVRCTGNINAPSNIVYRNTGGLGGQVQVIGTCTFLGSYMMAVAAAGENAPGFEDPNRPADPSYRLTRTSPAGTIRDAVPCTGVDFEGDRRPAPEGGACDLGADEYREGQ